MKIDYHIEDEKLQHGICREAAKISTLLWGKINKNEYLTGEVIQRKRQSKLNILILLPYSPLEEAFEKQNKQLKAKEKNNLDL